MGQIEMLAGLIPGGGATQRLPRMIGTARTLEHILDARPITAREALELGLVQRLVPPDDLVAETQKVAARYARRSPVAVAALKYAVYFATSRRLGRGLDMELAGFLAAGSTAGMKRGLHTFTAEMERLGDTPFLADPEPWADGTKVDLVS